LGNVQRGRCRSNKRGCRGREATLNAGQGQGKKEGKGEWDQGRPYFKGVGGSFSEGKKGTMQSKKVSGQLLGRERGLRGEQSGEMTKTKPGKEGGVRRNHRKIPKKRTREPRPGRGGWGNKLTERIEARPKN